MPDTLVGLLAQNINLIKSGNIHTDMDTQNKEFLSPKRFVAIIPARFASTRFPGKPLVEIGGKTMIQRVYEQVSKAVDKVFVATDDVRIQEACVSFGANVIMTSELHRSGTDRCYEAYTKIGEDFDIIINVQGDEPFIQPEQIESLKACFEDDNTQIATMAKQISKAEGTEFLVDPNHPKLIVNKNNEAMYFSRSVIPFVRGEQTDNWLNSFPYLKHVGIYAYQSDVLQQLVNLPASSLEIAESLEQLRWLENGFKIKVGYTNVDSIGIDTPEDLEKVRKFF